MHTLRLGLSVVGMVGLLASVASPSKAGQYSGLYVFGDSLSDTGNLFALSGGIFPPTNQYYQGRFSDGILWVEHLAPRLGLTYTQATNFALAGAGSGTDHVVSFLPGMQQQVASFISLAPAADPNALYVVWAGANDYLAIGNTSPTAPSENIATAIANLAAHGARNFLVPNLPDLGLLPSTRNTPEGLIATALSRQHNINLRTKLETLRGQLPQTDIDLFNVESLFDQLFANPSAFGMTNVTDPALTVSPLNSTGYLFWDDVHPSKGGHALLGQYAYTALVPEPGTIALLVSMGIVGGVSLRRKRRA